MKVLVLGGTRFLGPFIVNELVKQSHEVACASRSHCALFDTPVHTFSGDVDDPDFLAEVMTTWQPEGVIDLLHHSAAHAQHVVRAGKSVQHSVHVSCTSVYGPTPICPVEENTDLIRAEFTTPEVVEQMAADQVVLSAMAEKTLPATLVRLSHLYGPRDPRCAEWYFTRRVLEGRPHLAIPDMGLAITQRGFVQNMAWGVVRALTTRKAIGQTYNLGDEKVYTLLQLARGVARALGHKWEIYSVPGQVWQTPYSRSTCFLDLRKARTQLRYQDRMVPRDGLELTLAWLHQHPRGEEWRCPEIEDPFNYAREDEVIAQYGIKLEPEKLDEAQRHKEI